MRILHIITSLRIGGAEKLVSEIVPQLQAVGHQADVLLFDGTETALKQLLQEKKVTIYELGKGGSVYNPIYLFRLIPFFRKYDIIHTHNTACQLFAAIASVFCSVTLITTEHNTSNRRRSWKGYKPIDKWMYSRYKSIICISDKSKENLCAYLGTDKNMQTVYNGIDCSLYQSAMPERTWQSDKKIVTMVAGFRHQKDQETLIKAFLHLQTDQYELWLVGDGERRPILEELVKELNLQESVRFWGIRNDIPTILKSSDIVVMSSHYEGLSLSSLEGMASGKPFVASDVDGLREITYGAGVLFPKGDSVALANVIVQLSNDNDYYQNIANQCLLRAIDYDIRKTVEGYNNIYYSTTQLMNQKND